VTVRPSRREDDAALARLAALDSGRAPLGPSLVAESDARILAALPIGAGRPIADPFEPTAELVALLELRRSQLADDRRQPRGRLGARLRGLARGARLAARA
jgi:hypothetical protein